MSSLLIVNIGKLVQVREQTLSPLRGEQMDVLPVMDNAFLLAETGKISAFGPMSELPQDFARSVNEVIDAARYFSEDRKTATNGGLLADEYTGSSYFEKDQLKPADYNILKDMQEGDISEPFESLDNEGRSGNTIYKIIMLEKIIPSHVADYKTDFNVLLDDANMKNSNAAIDTFISEKQKSTYIVIDPLFKECNFMREGWVK